MFPRACGLAAPAKACATSARARQTPGANAGCCRDFYETREWTPDPSARLTACLYEGYALQTIHIPGAQPHPTKLVQSAAMAAVAPPRPSYRPHLPPRLISAGILSGRAA